MLQGTIGLKEVIQANGKSFLLRSIDGPAMIDSKHEPMDFGTCDSKPHAQ